MCFQSTGCTAESGESRLRECPASARFALCFYSIELHVSLEVGGAFKQIPDLKPGCSHWLSSSAWILSLSCSPMSFQLTTGDRNGIRKLTRPAIHCRLVPSPSRRLFFYCMSNPVSPCRSLCLPSGPSTAPWPRSLI